MSGNQRPPSYSGSPATGERLCVLFWGKPSGRSEGLLPGSHELSLDVYRFVKFAFTTAMAHYPWAGSEELWGQAALRLALSGHNVSALVPRYESIAPRLQSLRAAGATVQLRASTRARWPVRLWRELERKWRTRMNPDLAWIKSQRPDLVCVSSGNYYDGLFYMEFCAVRYCCACLRSDGGT